MPVRNVGGRGILITNTCINIKYLSSFALADVSTSQQDIDKLVGLHVRIFIDKSLKNPRWVESIAAYECKQFLQ